jgi:hypothetical protein
MRAYALPLTLTILTGCVAAPIAAETPTVAEADDQVATCKVAKDPLNPLVVEWPGTAKVDLEAVSKQSVVVVSYRGCTLKVLSGCSAKGKYQFVDTTPTRDKVAIGSDTDLFARLPLGAASLKGELRAGSTLELDYVAVGQHLASAPGKLAGDCEGATHYVRSMTVGAYSLDAFASAAGAAEVGVGSAGAGVGRREQVRRLRGAGDVDGCSKAGSRSTCSAVLQLGLTPLAGAASSEADEGEPVAAGGGAEDGVVSRKAEKQAYKLREGAFSKFNAGDATGCLADLDRADKIDPTTADEGYAQSFRYMCELLAGKCTQGKARMAAWFKRWGGPNGFSPQQATQMAELHSKGKCK